MLVTREQLRSGDLPAVCVKTGEPADATVSVRFSYLPPWTFLLLLPGIAPFLIALVFATERITGRLPITAAAHERYHAHGRIYGWAMAVTAISLVLAMVRTEPWWLVGVGVGAALFAVVEVRRSADWVAARPARATGEVQLRRVHPAFAAAVADQRRTGPHPTP